MTNDPKSPLQLCFLGTGTSTTLPLTPCLTRANPYPITHQSAVPLRLPDVDDSGNTVRPFPPGRYDPDGEWPSDIPCASCRSSVDQGVPEGWKNKRGNTSVVVRRRVGNGWRNILVDCGKSFVENSRRFFPRWGVKTIDAVLLTHGHADAYFGLDDLREWTMRQRRSIPIYLNKATFDTVAASFPYLVDAKKASGGGDVPSLDFRIIEDHSTFTICDIEVTSYPVYHGVYFHEPSPEDPIEGPEPLICLGFGFDKSILYISDVSEIPPETWHHFEADGLLPPAGNVTAPDSEPSKEQSDQHQPYGRPSAQGLDLAQSRSGPVPLKVLIIDALWPLRRHLSHFSLGQGLAAALRLCPDMTYLVGFTHPMTHFMWEEICLSISGRSTPHSIHSATGAKSRSDSEPNGTQNGQRQQGYIQDWRADHPDRPIADGLLERVKRDREFKGPDGLYDQWRRSHGGRVGEVEPAWDGLVIQVDEVQEGREARESSGEHDSSDRTRWEVVQGSEGTVGGWGI